MSIETLEFDAKGDALAGFPAVYVEFEVSTECASEGSNEFSRDLVMHETQITEITYVHDGEDCMDELNTWFIKDGDKHISFYDEIYKRIDNKVEGNLWGYMYD